MSFALETKRLILREWQDSDRNALAAILGDTHVRRFYPSVATPELVNAQIDYAIAKTAENGFHFGAAELKETGQLVGLIGLGVIPEDTQAAIPGTPRVEIGWQFDKAFWGQGLAPEAAHAWLAHGWAIGLDEIVAFTAVPNTPSQRVMEKIGMVRDVNGDFAHPRIADGHVLKPHVLYRIGRP